MRQTGNKRGGDVSGNNHSSIDLLNAMDQFVKNLEASYREISKNMIVFRSKIADIKTNLELQPLPINNKLNRTTNKNKPKALKKLNNQLSKNYKNELPSMRDSRSVNTSADYTDDTFGSLDINFTDNELMQMQPTQLIDEYPSIDKEGDDPIWEEYLQIERYKMRRYDPMKPIQDIDSMIVVNWARMNEKQRKDYVLVEKRKIQKQDSIKNLRKQNTKKIKQIKEVNNQKNNQTSNAFANLLSKRMKKQAGNQKGTINQVVPNLQYLNQRDTLRGIQEGSSLSDSKDKTQQIIQASDLIQAIKKEKEQAKYDKPALEAKLKRLFQNFQA